MLESLNPQPQDKILALIAAYRDDPREGKIDLGVGVYKDATGLTPVMRAVKLAEKKLWEEERTKTYTGLAGEPAFNQTGQRHVDVFGESEFAGASSIQVRQLRAQQTFAGGIGQLQ